MSVYADTSFLVSLYSPDANSTEAARQMRDTPLPLLLTLFGEVEMTNALQLRRFRGELRPTEIHAAYAAFRADVRSGLFSPRPMPAAAYEQARKLSLRWTPRLGTRTLDLIHVASALALDADTFCTFDNNQKRLAKATGLKVP